jgi:hypothetical protein
MTEVRREAFSIFICRVLTVCSPEVAIKRVSSSIPTDEES